MSFYGFNSAAINGGVSAAIAGEMLVEAVSSFGADGTRIRMAQATFASRSDSLAKGVRNVIAKAAFETGSGLFAQWSILSDARIAMRGVSAFRVTAIGAYMPAASSFAAEPTQILPGAAKMAGAGALNVMPLLTAGGVAAMAGVSTFVADAGIKLSGQSTTQREGRLTIVGAGSLGAQALRTAMGEASFAGTSSFGADHTFVHPGRATIYGYSNFTAIGTTDFANFIGDSDFVARGGIWQYGSMTAQSTSSLDAERTVYTAGELVPYVATSNFVADSRLAIRSSATFSVKSAMKTAERLALQSAAEFIGGSDLLADPNTIIPGDAINWISTSDLYAQWTVLRQGEASFLSSSDFYAIGKTNADALDPPERTMTRPYSEREMRRPFIDREMRRRP